MTPKSQSQLLKDLDLLVGTGMGIAPIAPALCSLLSKIVGAEAGGICWFSESGAPEGFYQQGSSREVEELFMNHYEELFVGPHEYTPFWSVRNSGRGVGHGWLASKEYLRSNTYNLLIKPNHWQFLLDVVVEVADVPRFSACFFRSVQNPFTQADAKKLTGLIPTLRRIFNRHSNPLVVQSKTTEGGYMLLCKDGLQVEMIDAAARQLLSTIRLFDQNVSTARQSSEPPRFVQLLCKKLGLQNAASTKTEIALAGGTLVAIAKWLTSALQMMATKFGGETATSVLSKKKVLVSVHFKPAGAIDVVQAISAIGLSPVQGHIAMYAAAGGRRTSCALNHRFSNEAFKKLLREIHAASSCADWHRLTATLHEADGTLKVAFLQSPSLNTASPCQL